MFQWKERCVGGKCRGRGGTFLVQSQKKQKGCVTLVAYFPLWSELSTWKHTETLPQSWGSLHLGVHFGKSTGLIRPRGPFLGHQQTSAAIMTLGVWMPRELVCLIWFWYLDRNYSQCLLQHMDSSVKLDWCPASVRKTLRLFLFYSVLPDARDSPMLFFLVQKLTHLLMKRQKNRENVQEEHGLWHQRRSRANSSLGLISPAQLHNTQMSLEIGPAEK